MFEKFNLNAACKKHVKQFVAVMKEFGVTCPTENTINTWAK
jgi:hypothetical protein